MPFLILGIITILAGAGMFQWARKLENKNIASGSVMLIIAGLILTLIYGLFYRNILGA